MNPILSLSWQRARIFRPKPSVKAALEITEDAWRAEHRGVLLHYPEARRALVMFHDALARTVEAAGLGADEDLVRHGLLDILARGQMMVHGEVPAITVGRLTNAFGIGVVVVVDNSASPTGLFTPSSVQERLPQVSRVNVPSSISLPDMLEAVDRQDPKFHSELVNEIDHGVFYCGAGHATSGCPCSVPGHGSLPCELRHVAS